MWCSSSHVTIDCVYLRSLSSPLHRVDRSTDLSAVISRLGHHQGSSIHLSKDTLETEAELDARQDKKDKTEEEKLKEKQDPPPIVKYIKQQVRALTICLCYALFILRCINLAANCCFPTRYISYSIVHISYMYCCKCTTGGARCGLSVKYY